MTTIKREKFMTIQAKGGDAGNGKDVLHSSQLLGCF
jgi:hypothetical protein